MKLAFETGSFLLFGYRFEDYMRLASEMKFDAVELWCDRKKLWPALVKPAERKKIKESITQYGLKVASILPDPFLRVRQWKLFEFSVNISHPSAKARKRSVEFYKTALDVGADLGVEVVLALPGVIEQPNLMLSKSSYRNHWERAIESLKECSKHAQNVGVCLAIENAVVCNFGDRPEELLKMVQQVGSEYVKVYLDIANGNVFFPPKDYLEMLHGSLASCIHVSDNDGSYPSHLPIGMGTIDFKNCIETLKRFGWDGYLVPETFYAKDPEFGVRKSKEVLDELLS